MNWFQQWCAKQFGWQYVAIDFGQEEYIKRVHTSGTGRFYVKICGKLMLDRRERWDWFVYDKQSGRFMLSKEEKSNRAVQEMLDRMAVDAVKEEPAQ